MSLQQLGWNVFFQAFWEEVQPPLRPARVISPGSDRVTVAPTGAAWSAIGGSRRRPAEVALSSSPASCDEREHQKRDQDTKNDSDTFLLLMGRRSSD